MKDLERIKKFLVEYKQLCEKHGLNIAGCGCCGSPIVEEGPPDMMHHLIDEGLASIESIAEYYGIDEYSVKYRLTDEQKEFVIKESLK